MDESEPNVVSIHELGASLRTPRGLSYALHAVQGVSNTEQGKLQAEWAVVVEALGAARHWVARGALADVPQVVFDEAASDVAIDLFEATIAPYRGSSDAEARGWLKQVIRSRVVDLLRAARRAVPYDARRHDLVEAQASTVPGYVLEDDPEQEAGSLQDVRRALGAFQLVADEIARSRRDGAEALIRGLELWLESFGARTLDEQVAAVYGNDGGPGAGDELRRRNAVYKQRSRGRAAAIVAVARLARRGAIDDLVEASLYRLLRATLADRARLGAVDAYGEPTRVAS